MVPKIRSAQPYDADNQSYTFSSCWHGTVSGKEDWQIYADTVEPVLKQMLK